MANVQATLMDPLEVGVMFSRLAWKWSVLYLEPGKEGPCGLRDPPPTIGSWVWAIGSQFVVPFEGVMELLGGGVLLEEVGYWGQSLSFIYWADLEFAHSDTGRDRAGMHSFLSARCPWCKLEIWRWLTGIHTEPCPLFFFYQSPVLLRYLILPHMTLCLWGAIPIPGLWIGLIGRNTHAWDSDGHMTQLWLYLDTEQGGRGRKRFPGDIYERELWSWVPLLPLSASIAWT